MSRISVSRCRSSFSSGTHLRRCDIFGGEVLCCLEGGSDVFDRRHLRAVRAERVLKFVGAFSHGCHRSSIACSATATNNIPCTVPCREIAIGCLPHQRPRQPRCRSLDTLTTPSAIDISGEPRLHRPPRPIKDVRPLHEGLRRSTCSIAIDIQIPSTGCPNGIFGTVLEPEKHTPPRPPRVRSISGNKQQIVTRIQCDRHSRFVIPSGPMISISVN